MPTQLLDDTINNIITSCKDLIKSVESFQTATNPLYTSVMTSGEDVVNKGTAIVFATVTSILNAGLSASDLAESLIAELSRTR